MKRLGLLAVIAFCLGIFAGCSDGGDGASGNPASQAPRTGTLGAPVTQNVSSAGGTVEASSYDTKVRLIFPAGALAADTVIKITPQTPATGDYVSFKLEPSNLFFAQPVTVVLEYPAGMAPDTSASLRQQMGGGSAYLETTVDKPAGTLTATLTTFGGATLDVLAKSASAPSLSAKGLSAGQMGSPPAPGNGTLTAQNITSISQRVSAAHDSLTRLQEAGLFEDALALNLSIADLLSRSGEDGYLASAEPFLQGAKDSACSLRNQAIVNSHALTISSAGDYKKPAATILYWSSVAESLGGGACSGETTNNAVQALVQRELDFLTGKLQTAAVVTDLVGPASDVKDARRLKNEASILHTTASSAPILPQSYALAASPKPLAPVPSEIANTLQTVLLDPALDPARKAAWTVAQGAHTLLQYESLIDAFGSAPLLQQDVQFVLTRLQANIIDSSGNTLASSTLGIDGSTLPVDPKRSDSLTLLQGDKLQLSGNIATLECSAAGAETLKGTFKGVEVASVTVSGGNLLAGAFASLTREWLLTQAGLPADEKGTHDLLIRRSSPCAATLGLTDDLLATIKLRFSDRKIVFASAYQEGYGSEIDSINADGTGFTRITINPPPLSRNDFDPSWSPDGSQIAFVRSGYIAVMNADGSGITELTSGLYNTDRSPAWSPDGTKIAFWRLEDSVSGIRSYGIYVINVGGGSPTLIHNFASNSSGPAWSPDGSKLAFVASTDSNGANYGIYYVTNVDGSGAATQLFADPTLSAKIFSSAWSPDGSKIIFGGNVDGISGSAGTAGIRVISIADVSNPQQIGNKIGAGHPSWSPDGGRITFTAHDGMGDQIWVMAADGSNVTQLTNLADPLHAEYPSWR